MKKVIQVPKEVKVVKEGKELTFSKGENSVSRELFHPLISIKVNKGEVVLETSKDNKTLKRLINTFQAHIKNLIRGVQEPWVYKLKICGSHFPISVKVEKGKVFISNYLGEKVPRKCNIIRNADVKIDGDIITITSSDKEAAGMTAGLIESVTQDKTHDRRVFQDGIYLIMKAGEEL